MRKARHALAVLAVLAAVEVSGMGPSFVSIQVAHAQELISGERVKLQRLIKNMASTRQGILTTGPSTLQDPATVQKYQQKIMQYAATLGKFAPYKNDPDVGAAANEYKALVAALQAEFKRAQAQMADGDGAQKILAEIDRVLRPLRAPEVIYAPFTDAEIQAWAKMAISAKETAIDSIAEIERVVPTANLERNNPGRVEDGARYDQQDVDRITGIANRLIRDVDQVHQTTLQTLVAAFKHQDRELDWFRNLDPEDPNHRARFLGDRAEAAFNTSLDAQMALAESVAAFQRAMGGTPSSNTVARITEIEGFRATFKAGRIKVLGDYKMPEPKSTDAERLAIAKEILAVPKYGFGTNGPIVLTTPTIVTIEKIIRQDTEVEVSASWVGPTWKYKWDEFKFATPIKDDESGEWNVYWVVAKKYASGASSTPIGRWVAGKTTKSSLILEENFRGATTATE